MEIGLFEKTFKNNSVENVKKDITQEIFKFDGSLLSTASIRKLIEYMTTTHKDSNTFKNFMIYSIYLSNRSQRTSKLQQTIDKLMGCKDFQKYICIDKQDYNKIRNTPNATLDQIKKCLITPF